MKIIQYSSTNEAVKGLFENAKLSNPTLTLEKFAKRLGLGTSTLKMIFSGKRKPGVHHMLCLARGFRLSADDTAYLEALALKESAKNNWERTYYSRGLTKKRQTIKLATVTTSQQELIAEPIILPLLIYLIDNKHNQDIDYTHLSRELKTPVKRITEIVTNLQKNEVLTQQKDGKFHVAFDKFSHRFAQKKYQKQLLAEAAKKVDEEYDSSSSLFVNYAFSASEKNLIDLQAEIKALMEKYMGDESSSTQKDKMVAQACFQIFPVIRYS